MNGSSFPLLIDALGSIPRFFGIRSDEEPAYHMEDIVGGVEMQALSGSRWAADDQVYWARYDLAFAIPYLKRNEVHVRVSKSVKPEVVVSTKVDEACNSRTPAANRP